GERPSLNWYLARRVQLADGPGDLQGDGQGVSWLLSEQRPEPAGWDCRLPAGAGLQPRPQAMVGAQGKPKPQERPGAPGQPGEPGVSMHLWRCQRR
ncbi:MAG: hypothetical protein ACK6BU_00270, partial [Cyanobacteriota bacterium]